MNSVVERGHKTDKRWPQQFNCAKRWAFSALAMPYTSKNVQLQWLLTILFYASDRNVSIQKIGG